MCIRDSHQIRRVWIRDRHPRRHQRAVWLQLSVEVHRHPGRQPRQVRDPLKHGAAAVSYTHLDVYKRQAITISGNGVHISSASLGDRNPGVNASVMFQIGYTFFSGRF